MAEPKPPEAMGYREMSRFVGAIERSGGDANPLKVERAQKLAIPMAVMVIVLFGAPLVTSTQRGGTAYGVGISLGVTIFYMLLFRVGRPSAAPARWTRRSRPGSPTPSSWSPAWR